MSDVVRSVTKGFDLFIHDKPGRRFVRHYRRLRQKRSVAKTVVRTAIGTVMTLTGVVLWFLPGPGWLFVLFGLAMFAGESRRVACILDLAEVLVRAAWRRVRRWWRGKTPPVRAAAIITALAVVVGLGSAAAWVVWL